MQTKDYEPKLLAHQTAMLFNFSWLWITWVNFVHYFMHFRPKSQLEWINKPPLYLGGQSYRQGTAATSFGLNVNQKPLISQLFLLPGSQFTDVNANMRRSTCASVHVQVHLVQVETHLLSTAARKNIEIFLALFSFDPGQWTAPIVSSLLFGIHPILILWYYPISASPTARQSRVHWIHKYQVLCTQQWFSPTNKVSMM